MCPAATLPAHMCFSARLFPSIVRPGCSDGWAGTERSCENVASASRGVYPCPADGAWCFVSSADPRAEYVNLLWAQRSFCTNCNRHLQLCAYLDRQGELPHLILCLNILLCGEGSPNGLYPVPILFIGSFEEVVHESRWAPSTLPGLLSSAWQLKGGCD